MNSKRINKGDMFAKSILVSGIIVCMIIFFYALQMSNSRSLGYMNKFYIISTVGVILFSVALLMPVRIRINIVLAILSIGISIYVIEVILSLNASATKNRIHPVIQQRIEQAEKLGITYDTRSKYEITMDLRKEGVNAYPLFYPAYYLTSNGLHYSGSKIYPLAFMSDETCVQCNESGKYIIYESDEHGYNNPKGLYEASNIDIVLIGDSYTLGDCVERDESIAGQLRKAGYKVLNLGMSNNGPLLELATLKEYAELFKPKIVFWLYCEYNDQTELYKEMSSPFLLKYLNEEFSQNLLNRQDQIDEVLTAYVIKKMQEKEGLGKKKNGINFVSILYKSIRFRNLRKRLGMSRVTGLNPHFVDIMAKAQNIVNNWGGQLYFAYLPASHGYLKKTSGNSLQHVRLRETVLSSVENLGIQTIDIHKVFSNHPDPLSLFPFRLPGHYNPEGYNLVAQHLAEYIVTK